jgi:hypothetical protein
MKTRRVDRQSLTDRLSHLYSPIIAYCRYILSSSFECLVKNWKYVYECVTMSNMYQEKTNKESVLFVAGIA